MPEPSRLTTFAAQKRLLIARSDLHRDILLLEQLRWTSRVRFTTNFIAQNRGWFLAGSLVAGLVAVGRWRNFVTWIPPLVTIARVLLRRGKIARWYRA